jgi:hypothetical protein
MTKSEKQSWEQERAKGRERFILRRGLLRAGLPFGIFMTLWIVLFPVFINDPIPPIWEILVKFGFYTLGFGLFLGEVTWRGNERDYNKPTEDDDHA